VEQSGSATKSVAEQLVGIRRADIGDIPILARHRADMFKDMGALDQSLHAQLMRDAEAYFTRALPAGEYFAWVAAPSSDPATVVAGAGVQLRELMPRPHPTGTALLAGEQGLVVNVYTESAWRRQGIAELLMRHILAWARERRLASIVLHASGEGRGLYERLGFVPTNEMRYQG
jgi:GNAT superfamily N-acetyltransferase